MRFLLFEGDDYYPLGGWEDFVGSYETLKEAQAAMSERQYDGGWAHVVDLDPRAIVSHQWRRNPWTDGAPDA